jgi:hypothetical protein
LDQGRIIEAQLRKHAEDNLKRTGFFLVRDPVMTASAAAKTLVIGYCNAAASNETADYVLTTYPGVDIYATFTIDPISGETQFSLRSNGYPVNLLAEHLVKVNPAVITGGGHEKAAGIRMNTTVIRLPLFYIETKILGSQDPLVKHLQPRFDNLKVVAESYLVVRDGVVVHMGPQKPKTLPGDVITTFVGTYTKTTVV